MSVSPQNTWKSDVSLEELTRIDSNVLLGKHFVAPRHSYTYLFMRGRSIDSTWTVRPKSNSKARSQITSFFISFKFVAKFRIDHCSQSFLLESLLSKQHDRRILRH